MNIVKFRERIGDWLHRLAVRIDPDLPYRKVHAAAMESPLTRPISLRTCVHGSDAIRATWVDPSSTAAEARGQIVEALSK